MDLSLHSRTPGTTKYISVKSNGKMSADTKELSDECKFVFDFINRPLLVLRGSFGFRGSEGKLRHLRVPTRSHYDLFHVTCVNGVFHIQGSNGKYMGYRWFKQRNSHFRYTR